MLKLRKNYTELRVNFDKPCGLKVVITIFAMIES